MDRGLVTLHGDAAVATLVEPRGLGSRRHRVHRSGRVGQGLSNGSSCPPAGLAFPPDRRRASKRPTPPAARGTKSNCSWTARPCSISCCTRSRISSRRCCSGRNLSIADFDLVLFHQANKTMVDLLYKSLDVPPDKRFYFLEHVGNSAGASLPTLLAHAWREGRVKPGSRMLMAAFGGGLSWGAVSLRWPADADAAVPGEVDVPGSWCRRLACSGSRDGRTTEQPGRLHHKTPRLLSNAENNMSRFDGKLMLLVGGYSGIGVAAAERLAGEGASLVLVGRQEEKLRATLAKLPGAGHEIVVADAAFSEQLQPVVQIGRRRGGYAAPSFARDRIRFGPFPCSTAKGSRRRSRRT